MHIYGGVYMTKKGYLSLLYQEKFIDKIEVSETEKDSDGVFKELEQGKVHFTPKYYKYTECELSDSEIDRVIQLRQNASLRNISSILTFFLILFIIQVIIMIGLVIR
jgi:hypothetical protein